jgi:hypothetical protein
MHALADGLTAQGFDVSGPVWEQCSRLNITNVRGAVCEVNLRGDGHMTWEYQPCHGTHADPAHIADMVTRLLDGGTAEPHGGVPTRRPGLTFKGAVGRALAERGMTVRLVTIHHDEVDYDLYAQIEVADPANPARGHVRVTDQAVVRWECLYSTQADTAALHLSDIAKIAANALAGQAA